MNDPYHPYLQDRAGIVHIGNFTGPFTACGRNHVGWPWRDKSAVPATCIACIDYRSKGPP